jgi:PKD repeat protein
MDQREGYAPLTVLFTDSSTGTITQHLWDFGDGNTSTEQNPEHVYSNPGFYFVRRRVFNIEWEAEAVSSVHVMDPVFVSIAASPITGFSPLTIRFRSVIDGKYSRLQWDFGDGNSSSDLNPAHTFTTSGTYTVALSLYLSSAIPKTAARTIVVRDPAVLPVPDFTANVTAGLAPLTVQFTDSSSGTITHRLWDFGDGTTSTATNPSHTYTSPGVYTVTLKTTNSFGYRTKTRTDYISAEAVPAASIGVDTDINYSSHTFSFTDHSSGSPTSWLWDFGDGTTSSSRNPTHTFSSVRSYWVTLTVTNTHGSNTTGKDITIVPAGYPVASFTYAMSSSSLPITVRFTDHSSGTPTSWLWDFGDGTTANEQNPEHTYYYPGEYVVKLTVANGTGVMTKQERISHA